MNRCGCIWWLKKPCPVKHCPWQGKRPVDTNTPAAAGVAPDAPLRQSSNQRDEKE